ncbi:FG-GAP repeat domain-containing protein [Leptolyngbya sp. 7M]|uniref:FG-GAP repeat domain-containing protein n=1 Tax=Leptolyngbya sp. 7M TaxID=2812896 RepID=UPI001B8B44D3|nr:VCBS repeat-containing protein [Leptolyngbya sp. 7M]QYO65729.1 VCBS repeat-containing protein [Leptolyngbya sp. 7M]
MEPQVIRKNCSSADFDGDGKSDLTVWRSVSTGQPSGNAFFYIFQSSNNTIRIEDFGQQGDTPTVVGDYDGDGKADVAVYRPGPVAGAQSFWYYRGSLNNPGGNITYVQWGQNGDFPASGDYDGDGKYDFVMQRNNGGGQARFWMLQTTAGIQTVVFGTPTDLIVPGDYDGDGKMDIAVLRASGGQILWFVRPSSTGEVSATPFAIFGNSATDFPTAGDYDGDGKTDPAIWRPSPTPGESRFWVRQSTGSVITSAFGQQGDYPVANFRTF